MDVSDTERDLMIKQYNQECKKIRDNFQEKYRGAYYIQPFVNDYIKSEGLTPEMLKNTPLYDLLDDNGDFSGEKLAMDNCKSDYKALYKKYEKYLKLDPNKHRWIMISPVPLNAHKKEVPADAFKVKMVDLYKKLCSLNLDNYIACVEAHVKEGYRPHIHMILLDIKTRPNRIVDKLSKHFNCAKNFIECKNSNEFERNFEYIKGNKQKDKMPRVKLDREERLRDGIPAYIDKR